MRKILYLTGCFLFSAGVVMALVFFSRHSVSENGFIRLFPPHSVDFKDVLELPQGPYYIAGLNGDQVYLGNYNRPTELLEVTHDLDVRRIGLGIADSDKFTVGTTVIVDPPDIYMMDSHWANMLHGNINDLKMMKYSFGNGSFSSSISLSSSSFVLCTFSRIFGMNVLKKVNIDSVDYPSSIHNVLNKQVDGFFCTLGTLSYDKSYARLLYNYHYRNEFISLDTNLNVLYRATTIDTISKAQISVDTIMSGDIATATFTAPPLFVNKFSCADGGYFFVNSGVMSSNEDDVKFSHSSVVDIYHTENGKYAYSFYLPDYYGEELDDFKVNDRRLVAINGRYLLLYHLNL